MNIKNDYKSTLEAIEEEHGIEAIKKYVQSRIKKKRGRGNKYDVIAQKVYAYMINEGYDRTRAIQQVEIDEQITASTINNHLQKFTKEAKAKNYYSVVMRVEKVYNYLMGHEDLSSENYLKDAIFQVSKEINISYETLEVYIFMHKQDLEGKSRRTNEMPF